MQETKEEVTGFIKEDLWSGIREFLNMGLHLGEGEKSIHITVGLLLLVTLSFIATKFLMNWLRKLITRKMDGEDRMKFITVFKYIRYVIYVAVILLTMSAAGIDITLLITASAALFVGIGLALQELFQDILGGILIVTDKSLRVGDIVEVDGRVGKVLEIRLRTTLAQTRDDKVMVIPNHKFMNDTIYNYTQNHRTTREGVRVGVAYGSDVTLVSKLLLQAVEVQQGIDCVAVQQLGLRVAGFGTIQVARIPQQVAELDARPHVVGALFLVAPGVFDGALHVAQGAVQVRQGQVDRHVGGVFGQRGGEVLARLRRFRLWTVRYQRSVEIGTNEQRHS